MSASSTDGKSLLMREVKGRRKKLQSLCAIVVSRKAIHVKCKTRQIFRQPRTESRSYAGHGLTKTGQLKSGKKKKIACFDETQFLLKHPDGRVRIWSQKHKSMDPTCRLERRGVVVWEINHHCLAYFGPQS